MSPTLDETDPRLVALLREAGREWGPLGVALTAAALTDPAALVDRLTRPRDPNPVPIEDLIEASSLGTPEAKRMRESVDPDRARAVVARAEAMRAAGLGYVVVAWHARFGGPVLYEAELCDDRAGAEALAMRCLDAYGPDARIVVASVRPAGDST